MTLPSALCRPFFFLTDVVRAPVVVVNPLDWKDIGVIIIIIFFTFIIFAFVISAFVISAFVIFAFVVSAFVIFAFVISAFVVSAFVVVTFASRVVVVRHVSPIIDVHPQLTARQRVRECHRDDFHAPARRAKSAHATATSGLRRSKKRVLRTRGVPTCRRRKRGNVSLSPAVAVAIRLTHR